MTITADMSTDSNWNTQRQLESVTNISSAFNDNTQRLYTNTTYISGSTMSYTCNRATQLERPTLQEVEQGTYPQESTTRVTSAGTVSLTTPQSGQWATRIGHGSHLEQLQEQPARQLDHV
jgi:hypothetical protein